MSIFRKIENDSTRFGKRQLLLKINDYVQHNVTRKVGRVIGVVEVGGDRKLTVELPNGKLLQMLSHREFCLSNFSDFLAFEKTSKYH